MTFTITLVIIITLLSYFFYKPIHKYRYILYIAAFIIGIIDYEVGNFLTFGFVPLAFFLVVMFSGVLDKGVLRKRLFMVRAELAVIGTFLLLPHFLGYTEYILDDVGLMRAPLNFYIGIVLVIIILPLTVTSFPRIRKYIKYKEWKNLHRLAHVFYVSLTIHLIVIQNERMWFYVGILTSYIILKGSMYILPERQKPKVIKGTS